ncbi:MAG: hypothetical protein J6I49_07875 [Bacteroidales bacterium]|nr:hypothetical protein [Bacteroidales bacterium]
MKARTILTAAAAVLLLAAGCAREKRCRCAVRDNSKVRVITIESGNCEDILDYRHHEALDSLKVDTLLCTDYEFDIDKND